MTEQRKNEILFHAISAYVGVLDYYQEYDTEIETHDALLREFEISEEEYEEIMKNYVNKTYKAANNVLLVTNFSEEYVQEIRIVDKNVFKFNEYVDALSSFLETQEMDFMTYDQIVDIVLDSFGWKHFEPIPLDNFKEEINAFYFINV